MLLLGFFATAIVGICVALLGCCEAARGCCIEIGQGRALRDRLISKGGSIRRQGTKQRSTDRGTERRQSRRVIQRVLVFFFPFLSRPPPTTTATTKNANAQGSSCLIQIFLYS